MSEDTIGWIVFSVLGGGVVVLLAYAVFFEKPRVVASLVGKRVERAAVVRIGDTVHYVVATIEGRDRDRISAGLRAIPCSLLNFGAADGWEGDPARNVLVEACRHVLRDAASVQGASLASDVQAALRARLEERGFALHEARVALSVPSGDRVERLEEWWVASVSYLDDTGHRWTCDGLELYLDAKSGLGHWKVKAGSDRPPSSVLLSGGWVLSASRGRGDLERVPLDDLFLDD